MLTAAACSCFATQRAGTPAEAEESTAAASETMKPSSYFILFSSYLRFIHLVGGTHARLCSVSRICMSSSVMTGKPDNRSCIIEFTDVSPLVGDNEVTRVFTAQKDGMS